MALETRTFSFLKYTKIKVNSIEGGFRDPIFEKLCQGLRVSLGIFLILKPRRYLEGRRTLGLVTRAIRAEVEAESSDNVRREKQG